MCKIMPKGPQGQKRPADAVAAAVMVGRIATGEIEEDILDSSKSNKRGQIGGAARASSLSPDQRNQIAKRAANSRWKLERARV